MTRGHRSAHVKAVLAAAVLAGLFLVYGWMVREARPVPEPLAVDGLAAGEGAVPEGGS